MRETSMKQHLIASIRVYLVLTVLLGFAYPFVVWGMGQVAFREKANGSLLRMKEGVGRVPAPEPAAGAPAGVSTSSVAVPAADSSIVGSALLGQSFHSKNLFHSRPSAAGDSGYDPTASGGTNLGPTSKKLADSIRAAVATARVENPGEGGGVPADLVTSSASGLDPDISPESARWQVPRIAKETGLPEAELLALVDRHTEGRFLGIFGEPRVNVLEINLDLLERLGRPVSALAGR